MTPIDLIAFVMLATNVLYGQRPTYISVLYRGAPGANGIDVFLTVYTGTSQPAGSSRDTICAGYTYSAP